MGAHVFTGGALLSYFELLCQNTEIQTDMEYFIESYNYDKNTVYKNNLDYITI